SDIFSFGIVLHEMLAGSLPFKGDSQVEIAEALLLDTPQPLPRSVPEDVRAVVERCLQHDPARRFRSAGELALALEAVVARGEARKARRRRQLFALGG